MTIEPSLENGVFWRRRQRPSEESCMGCSIALGKMDMMALSAIARFKIS
jgi:hypothetical protein